MSKNENKVVAVMGPYHKDKHPFDKPDSFFLKATLEDGTEDIFEIYPDQPYGDQGWLWHYRRSGVCFTIAPLPFEEMKYFVIKQHKIRKWRRVEKVHTMNEKEKKEFVRKVTKEIYDGLPSAEDEVWKDPPKLHEHIFNMLRKKIKIAVPTRVITDATGKMTVVFGDPEMTFEFEHPEL